jgi:hypothetical protein
MGKRTPNPRITKKELGLLKGALRRVFSRSELRRRVVEAAVIPGYKDPDRPRVTKWVRCKSCGRPCPKYKAEADHEHPIIPVDQTLESMSFDDLVDNLWCPEYDINIVHRECHLVKSKAENRERRKRKKS